MEEQFGPNTGGGGDLGGRHDHRPAGRWRRPALRPTRAPDGEVRWWERPAPESSDAALWEAVQRLQSRRLQLGMSVTDLARRIAGRGHPIRRETLSRILNGKQPTTWDTAERLAHVLGIEIESPGDDAPARFSPAVVLGMDAALVQLGVSMMACLILTMAVATAVFAYRSLTVRFD